jgi:hypothetical protein
MGNNLYKVIIGLLALSMCACGGGGGGGGGENDVPFLAGVYTGVLVQESNTCPVSAVQPIASTLTVNQAGRRIVADQGRLHHEGTVTSDDSFTAQSGPISTPGCIAVSTINMTNITSSSGDEQISIPIQCGVLTCTVVYQAQMARSSPLARSLAAEKPLGDVIKELISAVAETQK